MSIFGQSKEMPARFGINYKGPPHGTPHAELAFRVGCLEEDLEERRDFAIDLVKPAGWRPPYLRKCAF